MSFTNQWDRFSGLQSSSCHTVKLYQNQQEYEIEKLLNQNHKLYDSNFVPHSYILRIQSKFKTVH